MTIIEQKWPVAFLVGSLVILTIKYTPVAWRVAKQMYELARALEAISKLPARMDALHAQFMCNGGSSFRDALDRQSLSINILRTDIVAMKHQIRWQVASLVPGWESDSAGRCIRANQQLCALLGVDEDDIIGANWKNHIHPADADKVISRWNEAIRDKADFNLNARYISSRGEEIPVRLRAHVMTVDGITVGWIGTAEHTV